MKMSYIPVAALILAMIAGCAHASFKEQLTKQISSQAREDISCPDAVATKVKGPDQPIGRVAVWLVEGCGKQERYIVKCRNNFTASCSISFASAE